MITAKKKKKQNLTWRGQVMSICSLLAAIVFMPSTIIIFFGMIPTIIAVLFGKLSKQTRALTIGSINLAGCTPFLLRLWDTGHSVDNAIDIMTNPLSIVVMWGAAGMGYMIDSALSGIVGTLVADRAKVRIGNIKEYHRQIVEQWGEEVTGKHSLDTYGFAIDKKEKEPPDKDQDKK